MSVVAAKLITITGNYTVIELENEQWIHHWKKAKLYGIGHCINGKNPPQFISLQEYQQLLKKAGITNGKQYQEMIQQAKDEGRNISPD